MALTADQLRASFARESGDSVTKQDLTNAENTSKLLKCQRDRTDTTQAQTPSTHAISASNCSQKASLIETEGYSQGECTPVVGARENAEPESTAREAGDETRSAHSSRPPDGRFEKPSEVVRSKSRNDVKGVVMEGESAGTTKTISSSSQSSGSASVATQKSTCENDNSQKRETRKEGEASCGRSMIEAQPSKAAASVQPARAAARTQFIQDTPPHSPEAEQGVLGSMMVPFGGEGKRAISKARELLSPDAFYVPANRLLFAIICEMDANGEPVDPITLGEHLRSLGQEQNVGGPAYYTSLFSHVPSAANIDYYIESVRDKYVLRELVRASTENVRQAMEPDADVASLLAVAHQRLDSIERASSHFGRLPNLADISVLLNGARPPRPAELVKGLVHQGSKVIVGGTSKGRKTFSLIDLGISVATGAPWWGFETVQGPVCYINFEIQESFFCERTADICRVKKLELPKDTFMGWNLRGHAEGMENLTEEIVAKIISRHFSLVIFDPIYKGLGDRDENRAGDVASLMNQLERVAVKTGAAIAFGAHYSKGNQALKESVDRIGGSGVFARDPDSILTMTAHQEQDAFTVECTLRNFPPIEPFVLRWDWPLFIRTDLDPEALKQPRKRGGEYAVRYNKETLLNELSAIEGVRPGALYRRLAEMEGISRAQFYRLAKQLREDGRLKETDGLWLRMSPQKEPAK